MNDLPLLHQAKAYRLAVASAGEQLFAAEVVAGDQAHTLRVAPIGDASPSQTLTVRAAGIRDAILATDAEGRLIALWTQAVRVGSRICFAALNSDGRWSTPSPIAAPAGTAIDPAVCNDRSGNLWCAYQSNASGKHHIYLTWLVGREWAFPQRISDGDGHCFAPSLCEFGRGVRVVWDGRIDGTFGVYMREMDTSANLAEREPVAVVAESDTLLANATIAALDNERSVVIYEKAQPRWGRRNLVGRSSREQMSKGNYLQARRNLHGVMIGPEGAAALAGDMNRTFAAVEPSPVRTRAKLAVDRFGGLWLTYRQIRDLADAPRETGFVGMLTCYRDGKWRKPVPLDHSGGTSGMRADFSFGPGGDLLLTYASRAENSFSARTISLPVAGAGETPAVGEFEAMETADFEGPTDSPRPWLGTPYASAQLMWGDLHRHSNLSDCRWWLEGTPNDAYRYALTVAELDFLAIADHFWNVDTPDTRGEGFDLANAYNLPAIFSAFCAYEVSLKGGQGHMVVLTDEPNPAVPQVKSRRELLDLLAGTAAVAVPHHPGDPNYPYAWAGHDDTIAPIGEIYQPYRTSFEGPGRPAPAKTTPWLEAGNEPISENSFLAAWQAGLKLGVVASSDHLSTSGAYAGVWANGDTRKDILAALRQRHCYAATDKIELAFWADEHFMGDVFTADKASVAFKFRVVAPSAISTVELLADGEVVHTFRPGPKRSKTRLTGQRRLPTWPGEHFYYLRVRLADKNMAWSSPIWVAGESEQ